jgi:hypothetical protein
MAEHSADHPIGEPADAYLGTRGDSLSDDAGLERKDFANI